MSSGQKRLLVPLIILLSLTALGAGLFFTGHLPGHRPQGAQGKQTSGGDRSQDSENEILPVPVELARVQTHGISAYYQAASVIEANRLVDLTCRTSGRVQSVLAQEGDWVKKGAVLAELENQREKIQLRKAQLALDDQTLLLHRNQEMLQEELISQQEFDKVQSAWKMAEAERDLAAIALEETRVRAPFAGRVTERKIVLGQQLAAGTAVYSLGDFNPLRVKVHLPEAVARKVRPGQRVLVYPEALDHSLEAKVERISPVVDPATSTVRLTLLLSAGRDSALVGGFVKVRITTDTHLDALSIPKQALVEEGALRSAFVAEADTVRKVEVKTGLYDETHVEILEGLNKGEFVVARGQGGLHTGALIKALNGKDLAYVSSVSDSTTTATDTDAH